MYENKCTYVGGLVGIILSNIIQTSTSWHLFSAFPQAIFTKHLLISTSICSSFSSFCRISFQFFTSCHTSFPTVDSITIKSILLSIFINRDWFAFFRSSCFPLACFTSSSVACRPLIRSSSSSDSVANPVAYIVYMYVHRRFKAMVLLTWVYHWVHCWIICLFQRRGPKWQSSGINDVLTRMKNANFSLSLPWMNFLDSSCVSTQQGLSTWMLKDAKISCSSFLSLLITYHHIS